MRARQVGPAAVLVEVADAVEAVSLAQWARESAAVTARDVVPGARTVLVDGLPVALADPAVLLAALDDWPGASGGQPGELVELPVTWDGVDLPWVAEAWGTDPAGVAARLGSIELVSAFCGFAPGFAYLAGLPTQLQVPRLDSPRATVPAGSVALAGEWCGVYPTASPGGWRIVGHCPARLWDTARTPPALLAPGTRVRFVTGPGT